MPDPELNKKIADVLKDVPIDGLPVTLDLFGDKHPKCDTLEALETEVSAR